MIPAWRERELRLDGGPLRHLTYGQATDILQRARRRVDSVRYQLWSSIKEIDAMLARLEAGNPTQPRIVRQRSRKPKPQQSAGLFSTKENDNARLSQ